jgi:hypothetical protein
MENKITHTPVFPMRGVDCVNFITKENYRFLMYTINDVENFERIIEKIEDEVLFNDIDNFFKEKEKIFKIENLEFKYFDVLIGMKKCFVLTDETSTWDRDYNS